MDNTLIIKFTMKNVFFSAGRDEIKLGFCFSLFELLVPTDYSYCMDTVNLPFLQLLSNCLQCTFFIVDFFDKF